MLLTRVKAPGPLHGISLPETAHFVQYYNNGLAIWSGLPDITHITKIIADNRHFGYHDLVSVRILSNFELT